jgi:hypothetical protein
VVGPRERRTAALAESPHAGAGLGEELFGALSNRELLARAALTFTLALGTVAFQLGGVAFALLYAFDIGLRMVLVGTVSFTRFGRSKGTYRRGDVFWGVAFLTGLWLLLVVLPVVGAWSTLGLAAAPRRPSTTLEALVSTLDLRVAALALVLVALAVHQARDEARQPELPGPTLYKPVLARALCIAAFVLFGPSVFFALRESGLSEPNAVAVTYALSETYPFVGTLIDRLLHRWFR